MRLQKRLWELWLPATLTCFFFVQSLNKNMKRLFFSVLDRLYNLILCGRETLCLINDYLIINFSLCFVFKCCFSISRNIFVIICVITLTNFSQKQTARALKLLVMMNLLWNPLLTHSNTNKVVHENVIIEIWN